MLDRVPVNPGRVLITPENGSAAYYATMTRADNPTQEGTPLNKASLLKDATAALFGLGADAVPDDVFALLKNLVDGNTTAIENGVKIATGSYTGTGTFGASNPNSLTFDFVPKLAIMLGWKRDGVYTQLFNGVPEQVGFAVCSDLLTESYVKKFGFYSSSNQNYAYGKRSADGKTIYWYSTSSADAQLNYTGTTYYCMAIG